MGFDTRCPECGEEYHFPDGKRGQKVTCGNCDHNFVAGDEGDDRSSRDSIQESKGSRNAGGYWNPNAKGEARRERQPFEPAKGKPNRPIGKPQKPDYTLVYVGIVAFFLLAAFGVGLWVFLTPSEEEKQQQQAKNDIERALMDLQSGNVNARREAARKLNSVPHDETLKHRITDALRPLQNDPDAQTKAAALQALARWERPPDINPGPGPGPTPRQPTIEELDIKTLMARLDGPVPGHDKHPAMAELARRKELSAIKQIASYLPNGWDRNQARDALKTYGPVAEKEVLPYLNHPDGEGRNLARGLLTEYKTDPKKLVDQTIKDLSHADRNYQMTALAALADQPVNPERSKEVAAAMEKALGDNDGRVKENALKGLRIWGSKDNTPAVASFLEANTGSRFPTNSHRFAMEALGRWKDVRGVPALLRYLNHGFMHQDATKALKEIGPAAAKDVLKAANHPDGNVASRARGLLKDYEVGEDELLAQCVEDLKATEAGRRRNAAEWLSQQKPSSDDKRPQVAKALVPLLRDPDANVQDIALNATKVWLHKESVPGLVAMVENKTQGGRQRAQRSRAMDMLAELKDERGAPVVARLLSVTFERAVASQALKKMGAVAEDAVLTCLSNKDNNVRSEACRILQDIGTSKSLPSLEPLTTDRDPVVSFASKQAVNAIKQRNK